MKRRRVRPEGAFHARPSSAESMRSAESPFPNFVASFVVLQTTGFSSEGVGRGRRPRRKSDPVHQTDGPAVRPYLGAWQGVVVSKVGRGRRPRRMFGQIHQTDGPAVRFILSNHKASTTIRTCFRNENLFRTECLPGLRTGRIISSRYAPYHAERIFFVIGKRPTGFGNRFGFGSSAANGGCTCFC